jgi:hypothetical protein
MIHILFTEIAQFIHGAPNIHYWQCTLTCGDNSSPPPCSGQRQAGKKADGGQEGIHHGRGKEQEEEGVGDIEG